MRMWHLGLVAVLLFGASTSTRAEGLSVGDPAPKLAIKEFVKGKPVKEPEAGKVYVVEFWATWCGPCITSMPHLSELQKKHQDVVFIGMNLGEDSPKVKPFVEKMGDKMNYRVALDTADGTMGKTWLTAAGQSGIPTSFIVNKDGKVAWIGHPMQMDKPLADIIADKWDLQAAATEFKDRASNQKKLSALRTKLAQAQKSENKQDVLKVIDDAITEDPKLEKSLASTKFNTLQQVGDIDKALSYGQMLVEKLYKDDAQQLNVLAWNLVDPDKKGSKPDPRLLKLALQAAQRADELMDRKDYMIADTLAVAYSATGDAAKALETQERAVKLAGTNDGDVVAEIKARLEQFRKAANKK